jgi:short-subunit dehydrogenase
MDFQIYGKNRKMSYQIYSGKRILLTGASSGIGWYLASELVRAGASVVITSRREDRLQQLRLAFGNPRKMISVPGDISDPAHRQRLIDTAVEKLGGIDMVFNNAGVGAVGPFENATQDRLRRIFEVDFFGVTELTRLAIPHLHRGVNPAICIVSSVLAHRAVPKKSEYCAAKFALRGWTESLRLELKPAGIKVVAISPSTTSSEFFDSMFDADPANRPFRFGAQSAEYVAHAILGAVRRGRRELILSPGGKALVWLNRLAPGLMDRLLMRMAT